MLELYKPNKAQLAAYINKLSKLRDLPQALKEVLERIPADAHPRLCCAGCSGAFVLLLVIPAKAGIQ